MGKNWDWSLVLGERYDVPAREIYAVLARWKNSGFQKVLDLGCGKGRHALLFSREGFEVTALDISEDIVKTLKEKNDEEKLNIKTVRGDMVDLPFEDNSFDALIAYNVISHTDSVGIQKIIRELKRVVHPGGEMFLTFCSKESEHFKNPLFRIDENTIIKNVQGPEEGVPHYYSDKDSLERLLEDVEIMDMVHLRDYIHNGEIMKDCFHYFVLCRKP